VRAVSDAAVPLPVVVLSTAKDAEEAARLARTLVQERLAACVTVIPGVVSTYRWEGRVETAPEQLLLIKTLAAAAPRLTRRLSELHSYEVPEILVLPVAAGHTAYLEWIQGQVPGARSGS
jgi:periplasmic divalent cation tolerance protein